LTRVVVWSLRAKQAKTPSEDFSRGLTSYWQLTFTAGYAALIGKICILLCCAASNTTKGHLENSSAIVPRSSEEGGYTYIDAPEFQTLISMEDDQPELRKKYQKIFNLVAFPAFVPPIIATFMATAYVNAETDPSKASNAQTLR
jgi:hypothetical protein